MPYNMVRPNEPPFDEVFLKAHAGLNQSVVDNNTGSAIVTLNASNTISSLPIDQYVWSEDDTNLATTETPTTDVSLDVGVHQITLTVTNIAGQHSTDTVTITVISGGNLAPVANAGPDQAVEEEDSSGSATVTLDGSNSSDADGTIADYTWTEGETILASGDSPTAEISLSVGTHNITLTVTDDDGATDTDTVTITVNEFNQPPEADAGDNQEISDEDEVAPNVPITLDGSGSTDSDGTISSYQWTKDNETLANTSSSTTNVTLDIGIHSISLEVTDDKGKTATDTTQVTIYPKQPTPPVANAGADQTLETDDTTASVTLDGSESFDPDGTIISWLWQEFDGKTLTTHGTTETVNVNLSPGVHVISLTVTDNDNLSADDQVVITVTASAEPPTANAGPDQTVEDSDDSGSETITLDGSGSTANEPGATITSYVWTESDNELANTSNNTANVSLSVGTHNILLTVTDSNGLSATDSVQITVTPQSVTYLSEDFESYNINDDPVNWLDTGANNSLVESDLFNVINVSGNKTLGTSNIGINIHSHYNGNGSSSWNNYQVTAKIRTTSAVGGVGVTLYSNYPNADKYYRVRAYNNGTFELSNHGTTASGTTSTSVQLIANTWFNIKAQVEEDVAGRNIIRAKVWAEGNNEPSNWQINAQDASATRLTSGTVGFWTMSSGTKVIDNITVTPLSATNEPPTANAGPDVVYVDSDGDREVTFTLDGSDSFDPGGTITNYKWTKGDTVLSDGTSPTVEITEGIGDHAYTLTVTDNGGLTDTDTVTIHVVDQGTSDLKSSVQKDGITWFFDNLYSTGQYVNGDWWIICPAGINGTNLSTSGSSNGSMINPPLPSNPVKQGFDSRTPTYLSSLNARFPLTLQPNQSLVSSESLTGSGPFLEVTGNVGAIAGHGTASASHVLLKKLSVLTGVSNPQPPTAFRPSYAGTTKTVFNSSDINYSLLPNLAPASIANGQLHCNHINNPSPVTSTFDNAIQRYNDMFKRLHINIMDWQGRLIHPVENQPNYYREAYIVMSEASVLLMCDYTQWNESNGGPVSQSDFNELLINFLQLGIDLYGLVQTTGNTDRQTFKWPIIFAGLLLGHSGMLNPPSGQHKDTQETYRAEPGQPGWTGATALWASESNQKHEHIPVAEWDNSEHVVNGVPAWKRELYRRDSSSHNWVGEVLAARIMGASQYFNRAVLFDYIDRWMNYGSQGEDDGPVLNTIQSQPWYNPGTMFFHGANTSRSNFVNNMWNTYRSQYD